MHSRVPRTTATYRPPTNGVMGLAVLVGGLLLFVTLEFARAAGFKPPEDCLAYTGDHFLQCLYATIELQAEQIAKLKDQGKTQESTIRELRAQLDAQASTAAQLQGRVQEQDSTIQNLQTRAQQTPFVYGSFYSPFYGPFYGYPYGYPYGWGGGVGMCIFGC